MGTLWIAQREDDTEAHMPRIRFLRPAEDAEAEGADSEDTEGQMPRLRTVRPAKDAGVGGEDSEDTEGQRIWGGVSQEGTEHDDTVGHPMWRSIRPIDEKRGLYLVEVDSDEDVTGRRWWGGLEPEGEGEDTQGHRFWRP